MGNPCKACLSTCYMMFLWVADGPKRFRKFQCLWTFVDHCIIIVNRVFNSNRPQMEWLGGVFFDGANTDF